MFVLVMATIFFYCIHGKKEEFNFEFVIVFSVLFMILLSYFNVIDSIFQILGFCVFIVYIYLKLDRSGKV